MHACRLPGPRAHRVWGWGWADACRWKGRIWAAGAGAPLGLGGTVWASCAVALYHYTVCYFCCSSSRSVLPAIVLVVGGTLVTWVTTACLRGRSNALVRRRACVRWRRCWPRSWVPACGGAAGVQVKVPLGRACRAWRTLQRATHLPPWLAAATQEEQRKDVWEAGWEHKYPPTGREGWVLK